MATLIIISTGYKDNVLPVKMVSNTVFLLQSVPDKWMSPLFLFR